MIKSLRMKKGKKDDRHEERELLNKTKMSGPSVESFPFSYNHSTFSFDVCRHT